MLLSNCYMFVHRWQANIHGCSLWSLGSLSIKTIDVALNKILHKVWKLPTRSHTGVVHCVAHVSTISNYRGREVLLGFMISGSRFAVRTPPFAFRRPPPHFVLRISRFSAQLSTGLRTSRFALRGSHFAVRTSRFALRGSRPNILRVTGGGLTLSAPTSNQQPAVPMHMRKRRSSGRS